MGVSVAAESFGLEVDVVAGVGSQEYRHGDNTWLLGAAGAPVRRIDIPHNAERVVNRVGVLGQVADILLHPPSDITACQGFSLRKPR